MTLKEHIEDIRKRLEQIEFTSEAAVRQGIIETTQLHFRVETSSIASFT